MQHPVLLFVWKCLAPAVLALAAFSLWALDRVDLWTVRSFAP